jgi:pSer/pThr/pTyr-binding forkhead associated (FHA) protein
VEIRRTDFLIGSASDCSMCCRSDLVSPHHCRLLLEPEKVTLRDLASKTGTFVNGESVESRRVLRNGDRLRVGRLEFEVLIEDPTPVWELGPRVDGDTIHDAMAETVCNLLSAADEEDRLQRVQNPELRQFSLPSVGDPAERPADCAAKPKREGTAGPKATKGRPGKVPARVRSPKGPSVAAKEALDSFFASRKS